MPGIIQNHKTFLCVSNSFRFPTDPNCQTIDRQFLWGSSLLISPVLEQGAVELSAYLPPGIWYSLHNVSHSTQITPHSIFICYLVKATMIVVIP